MSITEANPATIAHLWQRLRSMMRRASFIVGALPALAALASLTRRQHREIASCITRLEAIARKLIFVAAAELHSSQRNAVQPAISTRVEIVTPVLAGWSARLQPRILRSPGLRLTGRRGAPRSQSLTSETIR